jgi:hypothetical protein
MYCALMKSEILYLFKSIYDTFKGAGILQSV